MNIPDDSTIEFNTTEQLVDFLAAYESRGATSQFNVVSIHGKWRLTFYGAF